MSRSEMTPEELDAIESRANAAAPGPWRAPRRKHLEQVVFFASDDPEDVIVLAGNSPGMKLGLSPEDAAFIAHAREDVPALVAEVRRLRTILEGRTTPPTDAEIEAHWRAGGHWLTVQQRRPELAGDTPRPHVLTDPEDVRVYARHVGTERLWPVVRWIALDRDGRPCARPVVGGGA